MSFSAISDCFKDSYANTKDLLSLTEANELSSIDLNNLFSAPSYMNIRDIFLYDFRTRKDEMNAALGSVESKMLSLDHTFQIM